MVVNPLIYVTSPAYYKCKSDSLSREPITTCHIHHESKIQPPIISSKRTFWYCHTQSQQSIYFNCIFAFIPITFPISANRLVVFRRGQEQLRPEGKVGPRVPELHQGALRYWWDIWLTLLVVVRMVIDELLLICLKHICYSLAPMIPTKVFWCQIQNYTFSLSAQVHRPPIVYIGCQLIHWLPWDFWWDPRCKNYTVSLSAQVHRRLTPGWKVVVNLVVNLPPDLSWRQLLPIVAPGKVRGLFNFCWQRFRWPPCWLHSC